MEFKQNCFKDERMKNYFVSMGYFNDLQNKQNGWKNSDYFEKADSLEIIQFHSFLVEVYKSQLAFEILDQEAYYFGYKTSLRMVLTQMVVLLFIKKMIVLVKFI